MSPTITFPAWVETPKRQPKQALAEKRLQFLTRSLALQFAPGGVIARFSEQAGIDRTTLHTFVRRGSFGHKAATTIERYVGRDVMPWEYLCNPLEIPTA